MTLDNNFTNKISLLDFWSKSYKAKQCWPYVIIYIKKNYAFHRFRCHYPLITYLTLYSETIFFTLLAFILIINFCIYTFQIRLPWKPITRTSEPLLEETVCYCFCTYESFQRPLDSTEPWRIMNIKCVWTLALTATLSSRYSQLDWFYWSCKNNNCLQTTLLCKCFCHCRYVK